MSNQQITVILNGYRRPQNLKGQVEAVRNQTIQPKEVWLWRNHHEDWNGYNDYEGIDKVVESNHNWKYMGRFALAMMVQEGFVALFDDDTVPGSQWFENCIETHNKIPGPGIMGGIGLHLHSKEKYMDHTRFGWATNNEEIVEVDLVGHAWFLPRIYLPYMWMGPPATWETGEDMHLSFCAQKYGGVKTYVPPHPVLEPEKSSSLYGYELGIDSTTESVVDHAGFFSKRDYCVQEYVRRGWELQCF